MLDVVVDGDVVEQIDIYGPRRESVTQRKTFTLNPIHRSWGSK